MYRLVSHGQLGAAYVTGTVRSVRTADGCDFVAETTNDPARAAAFPKYDDARGFQLRLALDDYRIEATYDCRENAGRDAPSHR